MIYCQAQSQLELNWTELVLFSINAHKLHIFQHNCPYHLQPNPQTPILDYFYLLCKWEFVCLYNDLYRMDGEMIEFNKWIKTTCLCLFFGSITLSRLIVRNNKRIITDIYNTHDWNWNKLWNRRVFKFLHMVMVMLYSDSLRRSSFFLCFLAFPHPPTHPWKSFIGKLVKLVS